MHKSNSIPRVIINNYPSELDLLNSVSLRARYDLKDIHAYQKSIEVKNYEYRKKLLTSKLVARDRGDDTYGSGDLLFQFKILLNHRNRDNNYKNYIAPIEKRQKSFLEYYRNLYNQIKKKDGIKYYTQRLIKNFLTVEEDQKNIQKKLTKTKSIIIKNKYMNQSSVENIENTKKKLKILKLSNEKNYSFLEKQPKKPYLLKLFPFNVKKERCESLRNNINDKTTSNDNKDTNNKNTSNDNKATNNKNTSKDNKDTNNRNTIKIYKIKNINKKKENIDKKFLYGKNLKPITDTTSYKILSKRGNIQFYNSIWRMKNINEYINPYAPNEVSVLLKYIKDQRKKTY